MKLIGCDCEEKHEELQELIEKRFDIQKEAKAKDKLLKRLEAQ